jgi:hypothetical protein
MTKMANRSLEQCRKSKDFIKYAKSNGGHIENCTKGVKVYGPNGAPDNTNCGYALIHSNHPKELKTGTRAALIKAFIAIGLGAFLCTITAQLDTLLVALGG